MVTVLGERGMLGSVVKRRWLELGDSDHVINCIRPDDILLSERLAEQGKLIQPSTDAIAEDTDYARTKRIIERIPRTVIIRAGLVDITRQPSIAYRNWSCNPLTPLEWADLAWEVRDRPGLHIAGREPVSRFQVADLVAFLWDLPRPVPAWDDEPRDRVQPSRAFRPPLADALMEYRAWLG